MVASNFLGLRGSFSVTIFLNDDLSQRFHSGDLSLEDHGRRGRSSIIDDNKLSIVIEKDPRKTKKLPAAIYIRSEKQSSSRKNYHTI